VLSEAAEKAAKEVRDYVANGNDQLAQLDAAVAQKEAAEAKANKRDEPRGNDNK
jgi:hypothetical protein